MSLTHQPRLAAQVLHKSKSSNRLKRVARRETSRRKESTFLQGRQTITCPRLNELSRGRKRMPEDSLREMLN